MEKHSSGFLLAVTMTVAVYLVVMAVWVDSGATAPADHAAAKVIGVLGGGLGIVAVFLLVRRFADANPGVLPGYVPREGSGSERS